ncbi:MAG: RNA-binding protein [Candidatus Micrarchaeota archaeon]|nr:RNA-binding protein [Candidatus Micrarchaeota archaeon]
MTKEVKQDASSNSGEHADEKKIVVPGEVLIEGMDYLPGKNCFREGNVICSRRLGILKISGRVVEVVPISGPYMPEVGDMVIGVIDEVQNAGWVVDINAPYMAFIPLSGVREFIDTNRTRLSDIYAPGDLIYGKVMMVSPSKSVHISMQDPKAKKFVDGRVLKINNTKVPRLIGRQGSMISMIKNATKCWISVGQNGMIWLKGENEDIAIKAIEMVEDYAHTSGLTDRVDAFLKNELGTQNNVSGELKNNEEDGK